MAVARSHQMAILRCQMHNAHLVDELLGLAGAGVHLEEGDGRVQAQAQPVHALRVGVHPVRHQPPVERALPAGARQQERLAAVQVVYLLVPAPEHFWFGRERS